MDILTTLFKGETVKYYSLLLIRDNWVAVKIQIIVNFNIQYVFLNNDKSSIYILVVDIAYFGLHFYIF